MRFSFVIAAALLAASTLAHAQVQEMKEARTKALKACEGKEGDERRACMRREMCAQAKDPKACEERFAKARAAHAKAAAACEPSKDKGAEYGECMRRELCAQTKDPKSCEAQASEAMAKRAKIREACKGKEGEALRTCIREQRNRS
jgi:hypothetical protein